MKKTSIIICSLCISAAGIAQTPLKTHQDSVAYAMGVSMAESLKKSGITDVNPALFTEAFLAQMNGKSNMTSLAADRIYKDETKRLAEQKTAANKKAGEEYLKKNASAPGVKTTASGLQYKTTQEGSGASPDANDKVTVHYHGTLIDGTVFDSSVDRGQPATFGLNQVIPGWTEGLQLMKEGGKTTFYIPSELAYGSRAQGKIQGNSTLIFDVELIKVEKVDGGGNAPTPPTKPAEPKTPAQPEQKKQTDKKPEKK